MVLENKKHEAFAQAVVFGVDEYGKKLGTGQCYLKAFGSVAGADQSASRLLRHPKVSARIFELSAELNSKLAKQLAIAANADAKAQQKATEKALNTSVLDRAGRIKAKTERHIATQQIVAERAEEAQKLGPCQKCQATGKIQGVACRACEGTGKTTTSFLSRCPGGKTGYMVMSDLRKVDGTVVPFFNYDRGLASYQSQLENEVQVELGELQPRRVEISGPAGGQITVEVIEKMVMQLSDAELDRAIEKAKKLAEGLADGSIIDVIPQMQPVVQVQTGI